MTRGKDKEPPPPPAQNPSVVIRMIRHGVHESSSRCMFKCRSIWGLENGIASYDYSIERDFRLRLLDWSMSGLNGTSIDFLRLVCLLHRTHCRVVNGRGRRRWTSDVERISIEVKFFTLLGYIGGRYYTRVSHWGGSEVRYGIATCDCSSLHIPCWVIFMSLA